MYHLLTGLYAHYTQTPRHNVLLLGISHSGKTAWLDKVRSRITKTGSRSLSRFHPTVGQNVLNLNLSQATLHFWDLGGEESLQRLWGRYYDEANVLVWAMDSQDWFALTSGEGGNGSYTGEEQEEHEVKRQESWHTLSKLKSHSQLASLPLLILFTKIDKLDSEQANQFERNIKQVVREQMNALDTAEKAELEEEMNHLDHTLQGQQQARQVWNEWQVILSSAKDGTGVDEFVEWLHTHAKRAHGK